MKRRLLIIAVFMLLGAATTVAVCWMSASRPIPRNWSTWASEGYSDSHGGIWEVSRTDRFARVRLQSMWIFEWAGSHVVIANPPPARDLLPGWSSGVERLEPGMVNHAHVVAEGTGWPLVAMLAHYQLGSAVPDASGNYFSHPIRSSAGILIGDDGHDAQRILPTRIVWFGFLVNTLALGGLWWLALCGPAVLRRFERASKVPWQAWSVKRRFVITAIFLVLGAVVNVAVTWMIAISADPFASGSWDSGASWSSGKYWSVSRVRSPGTLHAYSHRGHNEAVPDGEEIPGPADLTPYWSKFDIPNADFSSGVSSNDNKWVDARGWPALSLWYESQPLSIRQSTGVSGGIRVRGVWFDKPGRATPIPKALPLRPIWTGFAINTIFYATILWLLIPGPFALRRFLRVRRGLCPKCAYPMGESSVCTECGSALPKRARTT